MATGDAAAARGMDLVSGSSPANTLDTEDNKTRDYIATFTQPIADATATGDAGKLAKWGPSGTLAVPVPTSFSHVANKGYVDDVASGITSAATADGTSGSAPGKIVKWGVAGNLASPAPTAGSHLANKTYVDQLDVDQNVLINEIRAGYLHDDAWSRDITGTRRSVWMSAPDVDGFISLGYSSSSRHKKQNMRPAELTIEQLRGIPVVLYRYRKAVAAERAGKIDHAPTEIGTIAEDMDALGLWQFVIYEGGKPFGVHYDLLSLAALSLAQQLADRLDQFEDRLTRLEARE